MPYPNEHACRLVDPAQFVRFRRNNETNPNTIIGFRADGSSELQAFRYPKGDWTAARAQTHCQKHDGRFEAAAETKNMDDNQPERRFVSAQQSELRLVDGDEGKPKILTGYAAVFDSLSEDLGGFRERIERGAFAKSLSRNPDIRALIEHQGGLMTIGRTTAGSLKLEEDKMGLRAEITLPDTQPGRDVRTLIEGGELGEMSFAFVAHNQEWSKAADGRPIRSLIEVDLYDVSIVTYPAYTDTSVAVRAKDRWSKAYDAEIAGHLDYHRRRLEAFDKAPLAS